jgi:hypothetical protein
MWGMNAVTALELEAERRREVLLGDALRPRPVKGRTGARSWTIARIAASIAQAVTVRLTTLRI